MQRPRDDVTGKVCNQAPDSFQIKASLWTQDHVTSREQWPGVQQKWKKPSLDLMTSVGLNLGQRKVVHYDIWTIE